jgi:hypothetical protein
VLHPLQPKTHFQSNYRFVLQLPTKKYKKNNQKLTQVVGQSEPFCNIDRAVIPFLYLIIKKLHNHLLHKNTLDFSVDLTTIPVSC